VGGGEEVSFVGGVDEDCCGDAHPGALDGVGRGCAAGVYGGFVEDEGADAAALFLDGGEAGFAQDGEVFRLLLEHLFEDGFGDVGFGDGAVVAEGAGVDALGGVVVADAVEVLAGEAGEGAEAAVLDVDPAEASGGHAAEVAGGLDEGYGSAEAGEGDGGDDTAGGSAVDANVDLQLVCRRGGPGVGAEEQGREGGGGGGAEEVAAGQEVWIHRAFRVSTSAVRHAMLQTYHWGAGGFNGPGGGRKWTTLRGVGNLTVHCTGWTVLRRWMWRMSLLV
jgi:hypothetical protein